MKMEKAAQAACYAMEKRMHVVTVLAPDADDFETGELLTHFGGGRDGYLGPEWRLEVKGLADKADWDEQAAILRTVTEVPDDSRFYRCELVGVEDLKLTLVCGPDDDYSEHFADDFIRDHYGDNPAVCLALKQAEEAIRILQGELERASIRRAVLVQ